MKKKKTDLEKRFDEIFTTQTCSEVLNAALRRLANNKEELLMVLNRPDIPLHNNLSEGDIREYVKKRKISGSTRSDAGRRCRDTFTSLKKTCRKLGLSFWNYLYDRVSKSNKSRPCQNSFAPERDPLEYLVNLIRNRLVVTAFSPLDFSLPIRAHSWLNSSTSIRLLRSYQQPTFGRFFATVI